MGQGLETKIAQTAGTLNISPGSVRVADGHCRGAQPVAGASTGTMDAPRAPLDLCRRLEDFCQD